MAIMAAAYFFSYLLALTSVDELNVNLSAVQKLVDYSYTLENSELLPGLLYNNSINVRWAIKDSALRGLDGQKVTVRVLASASNDSDVAFSSSFGSSSKSAETYLHCDVINGSCANTSLLATSIPFTVSIRPGEKAETKITLKSEVVQGAPSPISTQDVQKSASSIFDALRNAFGNGSENASAKANSSQLAAPHNGSENTSPQAGKENFLDSLKPEGDSKNPVDFLRANPLISIAALGIVVVITGAYLLNSKD